MNKAYHNKALPPGTVLREWRLEQVLGVGGFGIVYRGRGIYFDELVAIKEYFPSSISDRLDGDTVVPSGSDAEEVHALGLKKFVEEAKLLWNLSKPTRHPNIVSVRSLFEIHGTAYMVMDFEDGISLSQMLKDGKRFTESTLLALLRPIAEGLERAHRVGVLHRDIKPANILVSTDGRPVLIDFGSARFDSGTATSTKVTFHTPPYAAIEQYVKTYEQGPWTDIYALGVALHECVTGEKPPEVLERLHGGLGTPLVDGDWPGYSRSFLRAVDTAMIIRPNERPQTISQWLAMFDEDDDAVSSADDGDAPTRFASFQSLPETILPVEKPIVAEPVAVAAAVPEPVTEAPAPQKSWMKLAIVAAVLACIGIAFLLFRSGGATPDAPVPVASVDQGSKIDPALIKDVTTHMDGLIADARKAGRPAGEIKALSDAGVQIQALGAQVVELAARPEAATETAQQNKAFNELARTTASTEAAAIAGDIDGQLSQLAQSLPWADPKRIAAAQGLSANERATASALADAKARAEAAAAKINAAPSAIDAIGATREAIAAYVAFRSGYATAANLMLPARVQEFAAQEGQARQIATQVIDLGRQGRPGLFASRERRDGWKLRQDNAAKAQGLVAELDQLAQQTKVATTAKKVERATAQAKSIRRALSALQSASSAAIPRKD